MASQIIPRLLFLWFITTLLSQSHSCGRNSRNSGSITIKTSGNSRSITTDTCNPSTLWDSKYQTCRDEFRIKRDVQLVDHPDADETIGHYRAKRQDLPRYLYRVIRSDEDPNRGITARNPSATYQPTYHVCFGSSRQTQYISTTDDQEVALIYATRTNNRIVRINVRIAMTAGVQFLDVRDGSNVNGNTATNFARASREVLLSGADIPSRALTVVYRPPC